MDKTRILEILFWLVVISLFGYALAKTFGWIETPEYISQLPIYSTGAGFMILYYLINLIKNEIEPFRNELVDFRKEFQEFRKEFQDYKESVNRDLGKLDILSDFVKGKLEKDIKEGRLA